MNVHTKNPLRSGDDFTGTAGTSESVLLPESLPGEASCFSEEGDAIFAAPIYRIRAMRYKQARGDERRTSDTSLVSEVRGE